MDQDTSNYLNKTHTYEYLSVEKELELFKQFKEGSLKARDEIIEDHLRIVYNIARHFSGTNSSQLEDLLQEGNLGLLYAVDNFDPSKHIRFSIYARMWVKEFIKRHFYKNLYAVSTPFRVVQKSFQAKNHPEETLEKEKKDGENISVMNITKKPIHLEDSIAGESQTFEDVLEDTHKTQEESYEIANYLSYVKDLAKTNLSEKEQYVLHERYFKEEKASYKEIADALKISTETVRNIEKKSLNTLKHFIKK